MLQDLERVAINDRTVKKFVEYDAAVQCARSASAKYFIPAKTRVLVTFRNVGS